MNIPQIIRLLSSSLFVLFFRCTMPSEGDRMKHIKTFNSPDEYIGVYTIDSISMKRFKNLRKPIQIEIKKDKYFQSTNMPSCLLRNSFESDDSITFNSAGIYTIEKNIQDGDMNIDLRFNEAGITNIDSIEIINTTGYFFTYNNSMCFVVFMGDIDGGNTLKFVKNK